MSKYQRFVALGDSQTEGLNDYYDDGSPRGWADRFAELLAAHCPGLRYANLAVRGRRTAAVYSEQLEPALALEPDLVSVMAGINDAIRPGADIDAVIRNIDAMYAALAGGGRTVMSCTFPLPSVGLATRVNPRLRALNAAIRDSAQNHGVRLVELEGIAMASDLRLWSSDRIHLNPAGHARLAAAFAALLIDGDERWKDPLPPEPPATRRARIVGEAAWIARFMIPKIVRMARGKSTGDGCTAKRPHLTPVLPA